jgi:hypothetical protein
VTGPTCARAATGLEPAAALDEGHRMKQRTLACVVGTLALGACRSHPLDEDGSRVLDTPAVTPGAAGKDVPPPAIPAPTEEPEGERR